jgi:catechol 2,3-dioxygenase-like lactoylglutathione lyase family enzyme
MPKIRHLAIKTKNPERLAKFYEEVFGMKCIHAEKSGAHYMSDGYLTLAILRNRGEATPSGINHFGFQVDDLDDIEARLAKWEEPMTERPSTRPFAEHRAMDPDGNLFDISVHGYDDVEYAADRQSKGKKVLRSSRPEALCSYCALPSASLLCLRLQAEPSRRISTPARR